MKEEMIYGVQYYRAPTPVREEWAQDLENIKSHCCFLAKHIVPISHRNLLSYGY